MDSGRCRQCGRPFTAGEVMGFGVLHARPAAQGGPIVDFPCPACHTVNRLVPHGHGRYAPPGQPPPPPPTEEERQVPWRKPGRTREAPPAPGPAPEAVTNDEPEPAAAPRAAARPPEPPPPAEAVDAGPMDVAAAFVLLGVEPDATATEIERVYREKALLCHPDKVAHLDPEFVVLAERKFRRLQDARDLLLIRAARNLLSGSS